MRLPLLKKAFPCQTYADSANSLTRCSLHWTVVTTISVSDGVYLKWSSFAYLAFRRPSLMKSRLLSLHTSSKWFEQTDCRSTKAIASGLSRSYQPNCKCKALDESTACGLSGWLRLYLSVFMSVFLPISLSLYVCLSVSLPYCMYVWLPVYLCFVFCLSVSVSV